MNRHAWQSGLNTNGKSDLDSRSAQPPKHCLKKRVKKENTEKNGSVQDRLEKELESLATKLALNERLNVVWAPEQTRELDGEVKGGTIYIYEPNSQKAVNVLRHEVLDYCLTSRLINPLVSLVNLLIKSRETEIYKEKEKLVEALLSLLS